MNIVIHQAICGQVADGGFGCIKSTLSDDALNKSIGFKSDLQDPDSGTPWASALRGFLLNNHFLLIKTFPDKSQGARPGRNFSHVLIIDKKDLNLITNIEDLYPYFLNEVNKTVHIEQIQLISKGKVAIHLEDGIKKRFNKIVHGLHKISDYSNTIIWVGQENYETALAKLWQILTIEQKHKLNLGINFNVDAIKKDKLNFITIPDVVQSKFLRSEYCIIKKTDTHELKEFSEQYLAGDDGVSEKIKKFEESIQTKKLSIEDIEVISKVMSTFENLSETSDVRKLLTLSNVVANYSPENSKGTVFKQKIVSALLSVYPTATAEDIYLLRKFKTDSYIQSDKLIKENLSNWLKTKFENSKDAKEQQIVSLIKLALDELQANWLSKTIISAINKFTLQLNTEKVVILFEWFNVCEDIFNKLSIRDESQNDILFAEVISKKFSKKQLAILTELSIKHSWYNSLASVYKLSFDQNQAVKEFLTKNNKQDNINGLDKILQGIPDSEIINITLVERDPRLIVVSAEKCIKNTSLLNKLDANNTTWIDIWSKAISGGNKLEDGILNLQSKVIQVLDHLVKGVSISENLLSKMAESHYASIYKHPQRKVLWKKLNNKHKHPVLNATLSDFIDNAKSNGWSAHSADIKDEVMRSDNLPYVLKTSSIPNVLWLFNNSSSYELGESKLIAFLDARSESFSSTDCYQLGLIINKGRYESAFNLINGTLIKKNSNFNRTISLTADTFKKLVWEGFFKAPSLKVPKKNYNAQKKTKILFLSANPISTPRLRVDAELACIDDALKSSKFRDRFDLENKGAVRLDTFSASILENNPEIIHFSGHADKQGIVLEDREGQTKALTNDSIDAIFKLFKDKVKCVVLNACYSENQAKIISKHGIYVVGMNDEINDDVAINFSVGFYLGIVNGKDPVFSYNFAKTKVLTENTSSSSIPVLWHNGVKIGEEKSESKTKEKIEKNKGDKKQTKSKKI